MTNEPEIGQQFFHWKNGKSLTLSEYMGDGKWTILLISEHADELKKAYNTTIEAGGNLETKSGGNCEPYDPADWWK